ncbi:MAG: hypothetical protein COA44_04480 [Arcobacter sp.]|nr:MAG: hypothetical protein COA44_04480 [Arcobacter sp.]
MRLILFILISISLQASQSLLDLYQKKGSVAIEKVFDTQLATKEYWQYKLKDINTSFGYFESIDYLLACDKSDASLKLYTKDKNNSFILDENFFAFIGEKKGDKQKEGDLKTPIGVYKLLQKLNNVDSFYGPLAFVTSYPNAYDKVQGKNGSGIWVHGLPLRKERDDYTKGCIAINNVNLKHIEDKIDFNKALVYIDKTSFSPSPKEDFISLLTNLYQWRQAWKENDINNYINFYDSSFKHNNGLNFKRFKRYKNRIFNKHEEKRILFTDINIIPYPMAQQKDIYLITFTEKYQSKSYSFNGPKELYVHLKNGNFTILAEK